MLRRVLPVSILAVLLIAGSPAQNPVLGDQPGIISKTKTGDPAGTGNVLKDEQLRNMRKLRNLERQKQIKQDTDKLLQLATELKQYVDHSNENILSVNVVRKAEEIEKLAHRVKTNMRDTGEQ